MKNYNEFCFVVLQRLMHDSDIFHDVYSEMKDGCEATLYETHIKSMKKSKLIELDLDQYCAGTTFNKLRITQKGIDKFMELEHYFNNAFNENHKLKPFDIKLIIINIQKIFKNTQALVATIITLIMTIGALLNEFDVFKASLNDDINNYSQDDELEIIPPLDNNENENSEENEGNEEDKNNEESEDGEENEENEEGKDSEENSEIILIANDFKLTTKELEKKSNDNNLSNNFTNTSSKINQAIETNPTIETTNNNVKPVKDDNKIFYEKLDIKFTIKNQNLKLNQDKIATVEYNVNIKPTAKFKVDCGTGETSTLKSSTCTYHQAGKYNVKLFVFAKDNTSRIMKHVSVIVSE